MTDPDRPYSLAMLERLVAFDTTSHKSNLPLIEFVRAHLSAHGVDSLLVHDARGQKANLYATIGPKDRPGVLLSGHTDVVPAEPADWRTDPFVAAVRDGRVYGRGTTDMKAFCAVMLATVPRFLAADLRAPVHLALSYDEEVGCVGVRGLIEAIHSLPVQPALGIVGEPTGMQVIVAHKGKRCYQAVVRGRRGHSSLAPRAVNAVEYAAELICHIRRLGQKAATEGPFDDGFDVGHTTFHTGVVEGGLALNVVPGDCRVEFEFRQMPGTDADAMEAQIIDYVRTVLEPEMRAIAPETGILIQRIAEYPPMATAPDADVVGFAKYLAERNDHAKVAFGTEGGLFQRDGGIPTVVCGPGYIDQAHTVDEFIDLEQVTACETFMARLIDRLTCEPPLGRAT